MLGASFVPSEEETFNFISIFGGRYLVLAGEEERFWRYLARAISQNQKHGLIYKLPFRTHLPLTFDVDLVHETPVEISDERLNALVLAITESVCIVTGVDSGLEVFALRKPEPTQSHQVWKNGCHVIIHGARVTTAIARKIRQHFMGLEIVHDFVFFGDLFFPYNTV